MKLKTLIMITFVGALVINATTVEARDCKSYTYENTRTERQALYHKSLKSQAHQIVRMIEACEVQLNGGLDVKSTQELHYSNDADINSYSLATQGRY